MGTMKCVLVVDDDRDIRVTLSEALRDEGYEVIEAENGAMALEALATTPVDIVLLDLMMPGMDGPAFLRVFERERPKQPPIVALTASRPGAPPPGVNRLLHKPVGLEPILKAIEELCSAP